MIEQGKEIELKIAKRATIGLYLADDSGEDHICFTRIDANQNDIATFEEFKKFYGDDLEKFKKMDQDDDGKLTHDEYEEYLLDQEE